MLIYPLGCKQVGKQRVGPYALDKCERFLNAWHCNEYKVQEMLNIGFTNFSDVTNGNDTKCYEIRLVDTFYGIECYDGAATGLLSQDIVDTKIDEKGCFSLYELLASRQYGDKSDRAAVSSIKTFCFQMRQRYCSVPVGCVKDVKCTDCNESDNSDDYYDD